MRLSSVTKNCREGRRVRWIIGFLAVGVVIAAASHDRRRQQTRSRVPRAEIHRWEEEGGAVTGTPVRPAPQPTTH